MIDARKKKPKKIIFIVLTTLMITFIFSHSLMNADLSGGESGGVLEFLNNLLLFFKVPVAFTDFVVRKIAHFSEFAVLGFLVIITLNEYVAKINKNIFNALFITLFTAVIDESIQLFVPGRSGRVQDVIIDFCGSLVGITISLLILFLIDFVKNKK